MEEIQMSDNLIAMIAVVLFYGSICFIGWRIERRRKKEKEERNENLS